MTKATTRLVYNAVEIYAPGHARYNEVDLFIAHLSWESVTQINSYIEIMQKMEVSSALR